MEFDTILKLALGQIIRHILTAASALLGAYGITAEQQTAFVNSTTAIVLSLVLVVFSQGWAYLSKTKAIYTQPPN